MNTLTIQEAADFLGTSRSRIWRATKRGEILAERERRGGRKVWTVLESDLLRWAKSWLESSELNAVNGLNEHSEQVERSVNELNERSEHSERTNLNEAEQTSPLSDVVYLGLVDRLTYAERKATELEITLRQHQLLLAENAESLHEDRAAAQEAIAKKAEADSLREKALQEAARAKVELESLKAELSLTKAENEKLWSEKRRPWYKRWFSKSDLTQGESFVQ